MARRLGRAVLGLVALLAATLLLAGVNLMLGRLVPSLPSSIGTIVMLAVFVVHVALAAALFLALPQALVLHRLGVASRWAYFAAGVFAGWMFLFVSFVEFRLNALAAAKSALAVPALLGWLLSAGLPRLFADFLAATSASTFLLLSLVGGTICAFAWHGVVPRLAGSNSRDWQDPILGGPPPYAD